MESTFQLDAGIILIVGGSRYDLHNCFYFVSFEYMPLSRKVRLDWKRSERVVIANDVPGRLSLLANGVTGVALRRRNPEMPFTEDRCIASISFLPRDLDDQFDAICPGFRSADEHLSIAFQSGAAIKIWAERVAHEVA